MTLNDIIAAAPEVSLEEMLLAREARAERQRQMLKGCSLPLVSVTLNIPGPHKAHRLAEQAYGTVRALVQARLEKGGMAVRQYAETSENLERTVTRKRKVFRC